MSTAANTIKQKTTAVAEEEKKQSDRRVISMVSVSTAANTIKQKKKLRKLQQNNIRQ